MRNLGNLDSPQQAERFLAYLLVQGIEGHFDAQSNPPEIWVKNEDQLAEAVSELAVFRQNPNDPKYTAAVAQAKTIRKQHAKKTKAMQKNIVHAARGGLNKKPHLTMLLIGLCGIVGLLTNFGIKPGDVNRNGVFDAEDNAALAAQFTQPVYQWLQFTCIGPPESKELNQTYPKGERDALALRTASLQRGEVWRLVTPIFIHHGVMHIVFNLYMLFNFGSLIERRYGWKRLLLLTLLASTISNLVQCTVPEFVQGIAPVYVSGYMITGLGGMSGVVYGLFGYVWIKSIFDPKFGFRIPQSSIIIMMAWLFGCMFADHLVKVGIGIFPLNIANWAHGIGLLVGMAVAYLQSPEGK